MWTSFGLQFSLLLDVSSIKMRFQMCLATIMLLLVTSAPCPPVAMVGAPPETDIDDQS